MNDLPEEYLTGMRDLLGDEYEKYLASFNEPCFHGLRVNTSKISVKDFLAAFPYPLEPVPWTDDAFYYDPQDPVTKHPYYYAGLYYIQEPSAMLPAQTLPVFPGDHVLDVCAAPGGKSTKLAMKLQDQGLLFANDISVSRAQALLRNIEKFGIRNAYVMAEDPAKFKDRFHGYFDAILIDAPCSGEGMFRKESHLIASWQERGPAYYAAVQKEIVRNCVSMLKEGGSLVYSTCTFSKCEDEEIIAYALSLDPSLKVVPVPCSEGFVQNEYGTKLFPHRIRGEGHFVSLLQKGEIRKPKILSTKRVTWKSGPVTLSLHDGRVTKIKEKDIFIPDCSVDTKGLRILRSGLLLGEEKKNRFEYDGALAMALQKEECSNVIDLSGDDDRVLRYLRGETITIDEKDVKDGYALVSVDGHPLGFVKVSGHTCKNKYPRAWIYRS